MAHNHASAGAQNRGRLRIVFLLTASYMVIEFIGAAISGSLALLADAAHMLTDVGGLGLALLAIWFAARPATTGHSYGFYRTEILAAMVNGLVLLGIGIYILYEAWKRFSNPPEVGSVTVIIVAIFGLAINVTGAILLRSGSAESLNVQGAFLEVVADLLGSIGVIVAGVIMLTTGWWYADPIFSIVIGLFIVPRTYQLLKGAVIILMEGTPTGIDPVAVEATILADPDVESVHDLHVWSITSGLAAMSSHARISSSADGDAVLTRLGAALTESYDLHHTTIQIERSPLPEEIYHETGNEPEPGRITAAHGHDHPRESPDTQTA